MFFFCSLPFILLQSQGSCCLTVTWRHDVTVVWTSHPAFSKKMTLNELSLTWTSLLTTNHHENLFSRLKVPLPGPCAESSNVHKPDNTLLLMISVWLQVSRTPLKHHPRHTVCLQACKETSLKSEFSRGLHWLSIHQIFQMKSGPLTLGTGPACLGWSVLSRSTTIRWTLKHALRQNVWSMCLDLHHIWPASTEGHTNTRQTITRNKYRQAPSLHHVTWICMLTAVHNFLSLTPTPPHPHIHLSNMTPLPTRRRPGSQPSSSKPDCPTLCIRKPQMSELFS